MSMLHRPLRKIKRRLRKMRQSPIAIVAFLVFAAGAGLTFSMFMQPGDMTLQQARLALNNGKPHLALKMIEPVLQKKPHLLYARCLQAEAQLALHQFTQTRETLRRASQDHPNASVVHELLVRWTFDHAKFSIQQPEFSTSAALQKTFDEVLDVGRAQARWFLDQPDTASVVRSRFIQACLSDLDIRRYKTIQNRAIQKSPSHLVTRLSKNSAQLVAYSSSDMNRENLQNHIDTLSYELEGHLKAVTKLAPNHFHAWMMYMDYLLEHDEALLIWESANTLSKRSDLPASLVARIVTALLTQMGESLPQDRIVETGFQLLSAVRRSDQATVDYKLAAARLHLLNEDQPAALKLLDQVIELKPEDLQALYLLAKILFEQENYSKASAVLQPFHQSGKLHSQSALLYGLTLIKTQQHDRAAEVLQKALQIEPDHNAIRATFLALMLSTGKLHKYENEVRDYYADNPSSLLAIRLMLKIEQSAGNVEQVIALVDQVEALQPLTDDHRLLMLDGFLYLKDHLRAFENAQALIRHRSSAIEGYLGLSASYLQQGQYSKAYEELRLIEKRFPYDPRILELQGRCMMREGRYDRAASLFQSIVDTHSEHLNARIYLAECLLNMGLVGEAIELVEGVLKKNPQHAHAHRLAVRAFTLSGQSHRAENYLSHLREDQFDENSNKNTLLRAKIKYQKGDVEGAIAVCERAVVGGNIDPELRYYFANLLISKQDHPQAEFHLRKLVHSRPHDPQAYSLLTSFYLQHQSPESSLEKLRALESVDPSLARLSQAIVLKSSQKIDEARSLMSDVLDVLIDEQSETAMIVANELAAIESDQAGDEAALDVYDRLVRADWMVAWAVLKQLEVSVSCNIEDQQSNHQILYALEQQPERPDLRFAYMRQYVARGDYERALELLDDWIEDHPQQLSLRRARAELLVEADRDEEALQEYQIILDQEPLGATSWLRKSHLHARQYQFPKALISLMSMADVDENATTHSYAQQSLLFNQVGLTGRSSTVLDQLAAQATPRDPNVLLMLGETSFARKRYKQSRRYLSQIPMLARQYVRAQLKLAMLDQYEGQSDRARSRVVSLAGNPRTVKPLVENVLMLDRRNNNVFQIVKWCDRTLPRKLVYAEEENSAYLLTSSLSDDLKQRWLKIRITLADRDQQWNDALFALDQLAELTGQSPRIDLARFCLAAHVKQLKRSRELHTSLSKSQPEPVRSLLMMVAGETMADTHRSDTTIDDSVAGFPAFIISLYHGNVETSRASAVKMIESDLWAMPSTHSVGWTTLFGSDFMDILDTDLSEFQYTDLLRNITTAILASEASLPGLSASISKEILKDHPENILANAMYAQSLMDLHDVDSLTKHSAALNRHLPRSSITLYLSALEKIKHADDKGAIKELISLVQREPNHTRVRYTLAQSLVRTERDEEAVTLLEWLYKMTSKRGRTGDAITSAIANDLAYLLAAYNSDRIDEAHAIAQKALAMNPQDRSLLDTMGWIEHLRGRDELALYHLSQAMTLTPPSPDMHYHIGAVYHALGQDDWAGYHLKEAVRSATEVTQSAGRNAKDLLQKMESKG